METQRESRLFLSPIQRNTDAWQHQVFVHGATPCGKSFVNCVLGLCLEKSLAKRSQHRPSSIARVCCFHDILERKSFNSRFLPPLLATALLATASCHRFLPTRASCVTVVAFVFRLRTASTITVAPASPMTFESRSKTAPEDLGIFH
jgi:hypothetical protein